MKVEFNREELKAWTENPTTVIPSIKGTLPQIGLAFHIYWQNGWKTYSDLFRVASSQDIIEMFDDEIVTKFVECVEPPPLEVNVTFTFPYEKYVREWFEGSHLELFTRFWIKIGHFELGYEVENGQESPSDFCIKTIPELILIFKDSQPVVKYLEMMKEVDNWGQIIDWETIRRRQGVRSAIPDIKIDGMTAYYANHTWNNAATHQPMIWEEKHLKNVFLMKFIKIVG